MYMESMNPVLVIVAPNFEELELTAPVDIMRRLGIPVVLAGLNALEVTGAHGITLKADMLMADVKPADYSGIVLPGGPASWTLRDTPAVLELVREMHAAGKLVGAICAAPLALEAAGVISGRRVTCWPGVASELTSPAEVTSCATETDGNIVTGRGPGAAMEFGFALASYCGLAAEVAEERAGFCLPY